LFDQLRTFDLKWHLQVQKVQFSPLQVLKYAQINITHKPAPPMAVQYHELSVFQQGIMITALLTVSDTRRTAVFYKYTSESDDPPMDDFIE